MKRSLIELGLNAVIIAVTDEQPCIITVRPGTRGAAAGDALGEPALPFGPLDPEGHRTLERAVRGWVREQAGLELGYVEQLYTFGDRFRNPREREGGPRDVAVGYLALVRRAPLAGRWEAQWTPWYALMPWEDWRRTSSATGRPEMIERQIVPGLEAWIAEAAGGEERERRRERVEITFGLGSAGWDVERVLERYELLYEARMVQEAVRDSGKEGRGDMLPGLMALDHRRMLATAMSRLRGKITYRPVVFELLPEMFTLLQLQRVVEALSGVRLHKQNFRRLVDKNGLVEGTGQLDTQTGGRPAELFCFRREVLRERPAPGVGLPAS